MKRNLPAVILLLAALCGVCWASKMPETSFSSKKQKTDEYGHVLTDRWNEFYAARKADRPKDELAVLDRIIHQADKSRLSWDFYEAWQNKVTVSSSVNWKNRQKMVAARDSAFTAYDEPVIDLVTGRLEWPLDTKTGQRLGKSVNRPFYKEQFVQWIPGIAYYGKCLMESIPDDYEFALWYFLGHRSGKTDIFDGVSLTFPRNAILDYVKCEQETQNEKDIFTSYAERWAGTVAELLGRQRVLMIRKQELDKESDEAGSAVRKDEMSVKYSSLLSDCEAFEKLRASFKGEDRLLADRCKDIESLISDLTAPSLSVAVQDDTASVLFRNLKTAELVVKRQETGAGKKAVTVFSTRVDNGSPRFYVTDSVSVTLPALDDGEYVFSVRNGKTEYECPVSRNHISLSLVRDAGGWKVFAADCRSGEPLETYDLQILKNGVPASVIKDFKQGNGGYSRVPDEFMRDMQNCQLRCMCRTSEGLSYMSDKVYTDGNVPVHMPEEVVDGLRAVILHDQGIYHRGDTVHCKAVVYTGNTAGEMKCAPSSVKVRMSFLDTGSKELEAVELITNEYGSVAADFIVPDDCAGGGFRILLKDDRKKDIASGMVTVDDFVLPEFHCDFDEIESMYFPGDTIFVTGRIKSYSGAPVGAENSYFLLGGPDWNQSEKKALNPSDDGGFSIPVPLDKDMTWGYSTVKLCVVSSTGESAEFNRNIAVRSYLDVGVEVVNDAGASVQKDESRSVQSAVITEDAARLCVTMKNPAGIPVSYPCDCILKKDGKVLEEVSHVTGEEFSTVLAKSGEYELEFKISVSDACGREYKWEKTLSVIRIDCDSDILDAVVENVFLAGKKDDGKSVSFHFGATEGPVWAVAVLYGRRCEPLWSGMLALEGKRGEAGSLKHFSLPYDRDYPESVLMTVLYFRNERTYEWSEVYSRPGKDDDMGISISRFEDKALPGKECSLVLDATSAAEGTVTVFDKSGESLRPNLWHPLLRPVPVPSRPYVRNVPGKLNSDYMVYGRKLYANSAIATTSKAMTTNALNDGMVVEEAGYVPMPYEDMSLRVRSDFATTLCWEPFVHLETGTGKGGGKSAGTAGTEVKFRTSDKLGTFVVQVFAHDRNMLNAVIRREMVVSMPVQLSVAQPQILSVGDSYVLKASLSAMNDAGSSAGHDAHKQPSSISGTMVLDAGPLGLFSKQASVLPGKTADVEFPLEISADAVSTLAQEQDGSSFMDLPLKVSFLESSGRFSDAVLVHVPVRGNCQTITESHSAVVLAGQDMDAALDAIRREFVNVSSYGAEYREISVIDMVREALGDKLLEPVARKDGNKVIMDGRQSSLAIMECLCSNVIFTALTGWEDRPDSLSRKQYSELVTTLKSALDKCRRPDGGYAWYDDLNSSPLVTATILERNARISKYTDNLLISGETLEKAVRFLDASMFSKQWGYGNWCPWSLGISLAQYLYVRSFYTYIPFVSEGLGKDAKKTFAKAVSSYLCPGNDRGLRGQVFEKTIRLNTLCNLTTRDGGTDFICSLGVNGISARKLTKSYAADVASLVQYVEPHHSGGKYCPNLVMPFRGLLASEAYCHSLLCDLMQKEYPEISEGIRLWLMLQKETQKWDRNFEFINAIASVLEGSDDLKQTKVIVMSKTYAKPYSEIEAAGNGFRISRSYIVASDDGSRHEMKEGDILGVGDRVTAEYRIWSGENRSFVHVTVPRPGCLRPVNQLSGYAGLSGGYRDVRTDRTEYQFEIFPEEESVLREEYFVTQAGRFTAPVITVGSQYAPHYRANAAYDGAMRVRP